MKSILSGFIPVMALAAAMALAVTACGGNDDENRPAEPTTTVPATESSTAALRFNTPSPPDEVVPGEIETAARKLLAKELEVDEGDFHLTSAEGKRWSDASLGCPEEGMFYAQVLTSGYKLVFDQAGTSYAVHTTSDGSHMVVCGEGR